MRTPTLRNVDKRRGRVVKACMHNGYFKSLEDIVHYYNTASELGLAQSEEAARVACLKTLSDTRVVRPPPPYRKR